MTKTMSSSVSTEYAIHHCLTKPEFKTFCYTWTIDNFWEIYECNTALYSSKAENYCSFYLTIAQNDLKFYAKDIPKKKFKASYFVCLKTNEKDIMLASKSTHEISDNELLCELSISRNSTFLSDGTLKIYFRFHIFVDLYNHYMNHLISFTQFALPSQLEKTNSVVPNEKFDSLVTFVINEECLQVNKDLLCSHSTVFEAVLKESEDNKIKISDTSYNILKELLSFLQSGCLSQNIKTDAEALCELFITAEKYDIKDLKLVCEELLIINTTIKNVIEHLRIAYLNGGQILERYAIEFIKLHFKDIDDNAEFKTLVQKYPKLLIQIGNVHLLRSDAIRYPGQERTACTEDLNYMSDGSY
ncbi:Speckle-type POZ protein [Formica fusca]